MDYTVLQSLDRVWNDLPPTLRASPGTFKTVSIFKARWRQHCFFQPTEHDFALSWLLSPLAQRDINLFTYLLTYCYSASSLCIVDVKQWRGSEVTSRRRLSSHIDDGSVGAVRCLYSCFGCCRQVKQSVKQQHRPTAHYLSALLLLLHRHIYTCPLVYSLTTTTTIIIIVAWSSNTKETSASYTRRKLSIQAESDKLNEKKNYPAQTADQSLHFSFPTVEQWEEASIPRGSKIIW